MVSPAAVGPTLFVFGDSRAGQVSAQQFIQIDNGGITRLALTFGDLCRQGFAVPRGPIGRAGVLRDHTFIAGLIFLVTELGDSNSPAPVAGVYSLNGIWNSGWENNNPFGPQATAAAKQVFETLCDAWNDTDDSRRDLLPI